MAGSVKFTVSRELQGWIDGLSDMERARARPELIGAWKVAGELMLDRTQQHVHVDTGDLKSSGSLSMFDESDGVVAEITYDAEYAIYENARGGDHAFMDRGFEESRDTFERALARGLEQVITSWR